MSRRLFFNVATAQPSRLLSTSAVANASLVETASGAAKQASEKLASANIQAKAKLAVESIVKGASAATANGSQRLSALKPVVQTVTYYGKIGMEVVKEVYRREKMSPPSLGQYEAAKAEGRALYAKYANEEFTFSQVTLQQVITKGFVALEIATFFMIGEMVGRRNIVGYDVPASKTNHH